MTIGDGFDLLLGAGVLGVAVAAVAVRRRETAVVLFLVFGVLLATLWARLAAPDIALAEAALGAGITGALLVDALAARRGRPDRRRAAGSRPARLARWSAGALAGGAILVALVAAVRALVEPDGTLAERVDADLAETGVDHGITAVLLSLRSYDTLLEVAVLAVAALAALTLTGRSGRAWTEPWPDGPPPALAGLVTVLAPIAVLVAAWLLVAGTSRPGGAFQAGALLAAVLVLLHLGGRRSAVPHGARLTALVFVGLLAFIALGAATAAVGAGWLVLDPAWAGAVIVALEAVLALSIGMGLAAVFVADRTGLRARDEAS